MSYVPAKGDALKMPSGPDDHMFVILTDPFVGKGYQSHLLVNFSSVKAGVHHDPACVIAGGKHPFLRRESFVEYRFARIELASDLTGGVKNKRFEQLAPVSGTLLNQIRAGIGKSAFISRKCQGYFEKNK